MKPRIFIGCSTAALPVAERAQHSLRFEAEGECWTDDKFREQSTPIENLFRILYEFQFALFVAYPDDFVVKRSSGYLVVRDNVIFEMGLFMGHLGRERVFLITPERTNGDTFRLPSDLTGIEPARYDPHASNLVASVDTSLFGLKQALRAFPGPLTVFDSRQNLTKGQLVSKGGLRYKPSGEAVNDEIGLADTNLTDASLEITRTNCGGVWEIEVRPRGSGAPTIPASGSVDRTAKVTFEARTTGIDHKVICTTIEAETWRWIDHHTFPVNRSDWTSYEARLKAPADTNVLVRLQDEISAAPSGVLHLRNIAVCLVRP